MNKSKKYLQTAQGILMKAYGNYVGDDPQAQFDTKDSKKLKTLNNTSVLGYFDAWDDVICLDAIHDPIGTAVHELLHANAFSDDLLPADTGIKNKIISFRGFEVQIIEPVSHDVIDIYHRALDEGVTELLTLHAYPDAKPAYESLLPIARKLVNKIGMKYVLKKYFCNGYHGLINICKRKRFDLDGLERLLDDKQ